MNIEELRLVIDLIRDLGEFSLWGLVIYMGVDLFKFLVAIGIGFGSIVYVARLIFIHNMQGSRLNRVYTQVFGRPPSHGWMNNTDTEKLIEKITELKRRGESCQTQG